MEQNLSPRPPRRWRRRVNQAELEQLRRDVIADSTMTDQFAEITELRIAAIEEVIAARWPRRIVVRARLARDLRRSVAHIEGATFTERRIETIGSGWLQPLSATVRQPREPVAAHGAGRSQTSLRGAFTRPSGRHR